MNKIKRSGKLLKAAFAVLLRERKLLLFPIVATGFALVIAMFFIAPIKAGSWFSVAPDQHGHMQVTQVPMFYAAGKQPITMLFFAIAYFVSMFLATFCNVAFYHEIMQALNGNAVSIRRGFRFALARWRAVLLWSLFAGLVGWLIQMIQERLGFFGRILTGLMGFVWSVACIFIIPTLVRETANNNPITMLRSSVGTLQRTWGETVVGFVGIGVLSALSFGTMIIGILLVLGIPMFVFSAHNPRIEPRHLMYLEGGIFIVAVLVAALLSYLAGLLNNIYRCALYIYATEGVIPGTFDKDLLDSAWKVK